MGVLDKEALESLGKFGWGNVMAISLVGALIIIAIYLLLEKYRNNLQNILDIMVKYHNSLPIDKLIIIMMLFTIFYSIYYIVLPYISQYILGHAIRYVRIRY